MAELGNFTVKVEFTPELKEAVESINFRLTYIEKFLESKFPNTFIKDDK